MNLLGGTLTGEWSDIIGPRQLDYIMGWYPHGVSMACLYTLHYGWVQPPPGSIPHGPHRHPIGMDEDASVSYAESENSFLHPHIFHQGGLEFRLS